MTRVAMGGTFDAFHKGHRLLLETAFRDGDEVVRVGVTTDELANAPRDRKVRPLAERAAGVTAFLESRGWADRGRVVPIDHPFGFALEPEWDTIVVTRESLDGAERINAARAERGHRALAVRVAPLLLAEDGRPVRATRVLGGEIDEEGRLVRTAVVAVGSANPVKVDAARRAFAARWAALDVRACEVESGVPEQPFDDETRRGALTRARAALDAEPTADFGVGIEAGLFERAGGDLFDVQVAAVVDAGGRVTWGEGPGFAHPPNVVRRIVDEGVSVGDALGALSGDPGIGRAEGAVGWLSRGAVDRAGITESAVAMALVPRARPELYELEVEPGTPFAEMAKSSNNVRRGDGKS